MPDQMNGLRESSREAEEPSSTAVRPPRFTPPRRPLISVNGHLVGHYPAYTMVTYERKKYTLMCFRFKIVSFLFYFLTYKSSGLYVCRRCQATWP